MWVVKVDDWPGMPYETWDQAHEAVWHDWQNYWANRFIMLGSMSALEAEQFPLLQEDKAFSMVLGNTLYLVQEVEMADR